MLTLKAHRVRLYPTPEQAQALARIAGCCRLVYNLALEQRRDFWRQKRRADGAGFTWFSQKRELPALKASFPFLAEAPAHCLQMALKDLDVAYARFFDGHAGYPKPRRRGDGSGVRFPDPAQIRLDPRVGRRRLGRLVLPKFGRTAKDAGAIAARFHRPLGGVVRSVTLKCEGGVWIASILVRLRRSPPRPVAPEVLRPDDVVGIDRGVAVAAMTSDGHALDVDRPTARQAERERRLARRLSRARRGSRRREIARRRLAAHKARATRRRLGAVHKITARIARGYAVVAIETLRVRAMTASAAETVEEPGRMVAQKAGLNRAILEKGWGEMRRQLAYKLAWAGGRLVEVDPRDTSRTCAACGHVDARSRESQAAFTCVACGRADHADRNAARNIRSRALSALGIAKEARPSERGPGAGAIVIARPGESRLPEGMVGTARGELGVARSAKREEKKDLEARGGV